MRIQLCAALVPIFAISACSASPSSVAEPATAALGESASAAPVSAAGVHHGVNDILLVHGAWADGSSWSHVIELLQSEGFNVQAVQLREQAIADDASIVSAAIAQIGRPLVIVGHSYGGAVIGEAATGASNVKALVFVAAFALNSGETINDLIGRFAPTPLLNHLVINSNGLATIDLGGILNVFAPDVPRSDARVLFAVQHPLAAGTLFEQGTTPAWKTIPSYFAISTDDQVINPDLERFEANRMSAHSIEIASSHVSLISHAHRIAELIERAAGAR
jgi:pimeloyl-ACP methyl ester carboxylesterase